MAYWEFVPPPPLSLHVERLWASRREPLPHALEWLLPSPQPDLVIPLHDDAVLRVVAGRVLRLRGGVFQAPTDAPRLRATGGAADVVGVQFRPGGATALLGGAAAEAGMVALDDVPGPWRTLRERLGAEADPPRRLRLLAQALQPLAERAAADALIEKVLATLHAPGVMPSVDTLRRLAGLGPTRFIARFHAATGLTPKRYARVLRFDRAVHTLAATPEVALADLALASGYADQAHFSREFAALGGVPPSRYEADAPDAPRHRPERKNLQDTGAGPA